MSTENLISLIGMSIDIDDATGHHYVMQLCDAVAAERARGDRLADRAVMLESRLAEVTRLAEYGLSLANFGKAYYLRAILVVAEGES